MSRPSEKNGGDQPELLFKISPKEKSISGHNLVSLNRPKERPLSGVSSLCLQNRLASEDTEVTEKN
jgi:hypothetical protein